MFTPCMEASSDWPLFYSLQCRTCFQQCRIYSWQRQLYSRQRRKQITLPSIRKSPIENHLSIANITVPLCLQTEDI